jgi:hypothetical protein
VGCTVFVFSGDEFQILPFQGALTHGAIALISLVMAESEFGANSAVDGFKHRWIQESCGEPPIISLKCRKLPLQCNPFHPQRRRFVAAPMIRRGPSCRMPILGTTIAAQKNAGAGFASPGA